MDFYDNHADQLCINIFLFRKKSFEKVLVHNYSKAKFITGKQNFAFYEGLYSKHSKYYFY